MQAFAKVGLKHDRLFAAVDSAVLARLYDFKESELQEILVAFQSVGAPIKSIERAVTSHRSGEPLEKNIVHALTIAVLALVAILATWQLNHSN